jgi:hypothetical protein
MLVPIEACKSSGAISTRLTTEPRKIRLVFIINQGCVLLPDSMSLPDYCL